MSMKLEVKKCIDYFSLVYFANHKEELPQYMDEEGEFVAAGELLEKSMKTELEEASKEAIKALEEATKVAESMQKEVESLLTKQEAKAVVLEAAKEAAKKAWFHVAVKKAEADILKASVEILLHVATSVSKKAAKTAAKETAEGASKVVAKKIPFVSLVFGGIFGAVRVGTSIYHFVQGDTTRAIEELVKAQLEVASGVAGCLPGVGTVASLGIDSALLAWDVGDAIADAYADSAKANSPAQILLKRKVLQISEAIDAKRYSEKEFLNDVLTISFTNLKCNTNKEATARDAAYLNEMVKNIFDNELFAGKFPTATITKKMKYVGFSTAQVECFRALDKRE